MKIYKHITDSCRKKKKLLAVLIDPDKVQSEKALRKFVGDCESAGTDLFFIGGSLLIKAEMEKFSASLKKLSRKPVLIFPGDPLQIHASADALLFLSLLSGRNPELLIGHHVVAAPYLKKSGIEVISTGYILVDCGNPTTAGYMSQSMPVPYEKKEIAAVTALAGNFLGMKLIYVDGGSGAEKMISENMIKAVKSQIDIPLIIGGGIKNRHEAEKAWNAGADIVVVGTLFEQHPEMIKTFAKRK